MYETILFEQKGNIAIITINRPDKLNALNKKVLDELYHAFKHCGEIEEIWGVILTSSGEKAFVAGADISEINQLNPQTGREFALKGQSIFNYIEQFPKPVVCAVNGFALGGGCELAMACHIRIASENAKFGQPEVNLGIIPGYGGTQRLTRLIGKGRSMYMILTGEMIDANTAYQFGLVSKVVSSNDLLNEAEKILNTIISKGRIAVTTAIRSINSACELPLSEGLKFEAEMFAVCCGTDDFKEGTSAFLEKRKPEFKGK
ncbi:MAG: enoyl-CoA hydratase-related protein [Ignavibacteria bacterium]|nr:enoyl-CoA hydratase-related protein [Ignavibacteria bacterium]